MSLKAGTDNPVIQVALDKTDFTEVLKLAKKAVDGGADWLEAGTPLIKSVGITAIKRAKEKFPDMIIVAEMKPLDTGRLELQMAFEAGADIVIITELAPTSTFEECVYTAQSLNRKLIMEKAAIRKLHGRSSYQTVPLRDFKECLTEMPKKSRLVSSLEIKEEGLKVVKRLKELFPVEKGKRGQKGASLRLTFNYFQSDLLDPFSEFPVFNDLSFYSRLHYWLS